MNQEIMIVALIMAGALIAFSFELARSDLVALAVASLLILSGVLTPTDAIKGFSSPATVTVACMFIISAAFVDAGLVGLATRYLAKWKEPNHYLAVLLIMVVAGVVSAFINNTAAVAVLIPVTIRLAKLAKASRKQFLMPLSFAAIFGGSCTLIGTSTNILVNTIYLERGFAGFGMFEFAGLGLSMSVIGVVYMMTMGNFLLRAHQPKGDEGKPHGYMTEVELRESSPSVGKEFSTTPLFRDFRENIISIKRQDELVAISDSLVLQRGDRLLLICGIEKILELKDRIGLSVLDNYAETSELPKGLEVYEVVVPSTSDLVGKPLNFSGFVHARGIIPLAVRHRQRTLFSFLQRALIQPGDVLVVAGKPDAFEGFLGEDRLLVISQPKGERVDWLRIGITALLTGGMITLAATGVISILAGALVTCAAFLLTKTISVQKAYASLDAQVLVLLSCMIGLGLALEKSGGASAIAELLVRHTGTWGPYFIVSALYLATSLLTEVISNNATAVLMAPIAIDVAGAMQLQEKPFLIAVMLAGSASFMTPVGYQTNTLIFAPGGYRFTDFLKVGIPLNLLFWVAATLLIPLFFPFQ